MKITRKSIFSGAENTRDVDVTYEQLAEIYSRVGKRRLIQDIVPHLSADDREFLLTGATPEEWNRMFKEPVTNDNEEQRA